MAGHFILLLFGNKRYFTEDISKYQCCQCWQSFSLLSGLLQYLAKNMALLVQKFREEKSCQNPFSAILRRKKERKKKSSDGHGARGVGGLGLNGLIKTITFFVASPTYARKHTIWMKDCWK